MSAESEFDPYRKWLGIPADRQPPTHYCLLGLADFEKDPDVIDNAAQRCSAHVRTFQSGERTELAKRILQELAAAQRCLLDPKAKKAYDAELRKLQPRSVTPAVASARKVQAIPVQATPDEVAPDPLAQMGSVRVGTTSRAYQARAKRSSGAPWLVILGIAVVFLGAAIYFVLNRGKSPVAQPQKQKTSQPNAKLPSSKWPRKKPASPQLPLPLPYEQPTSPVETPFKTDLPIELPPQESEPSKRPTDFAEVKQEEAPVQPAVRLAVPDGEPLQAARRWMRETYREVLSKTKTPVEKRAAIEALVEGAGEPDQVADQRFVLLQRASELVVDLVDVEMITLLNRELAAHFTTDYYTLQGAALAEAERNASSTEQGEVLYAAAKELLAEARALRRYDVALVAAEVGGKSARRAGDVDAQRAAEEILKDLRTRLAAQQAGTEPGPLESLPATFVSSNAKLKTGLICHWQFEEGEGDETKCAVSKRNSPLRNGPGWVKGRIGGGLRLEAGRYVEVVDGPKFDQQDAFTLAAWVKTSNTEQMAVIARINDDLAYQGFDLSILGLVPHLVLVHAHPENSLIIAASEPISAGQWHHLAATHDGSAKGAGMKMYVDGAEQTPRIVYDSLDATTITDVPLNIGQRKGSLAFVGVVDDVRIYDRALTAAEVSTLVKEAGNPPE